MGTLSIQPGSGSFDTYILDTTPTSDHSASTTLYVGLKTGKASVKYRTLLHFDCSSIPSNSIITSVTLTTKNGGITDNSNNKPCSIFLARKNFTDEANWDTFDGTLSWTTGGGDFELTPSASFTLSQGATITASGLVPMIQKAVNEQDGAVRLLIKADDESATQGYAVWASMEATSTTNRPKLEVNYTARIQWTGNTDGDADTATNWSPEVVPTAGDIAQFSEGSNACTSGTLTCATVAISNGYLGDIGTTASPIAVEADKVVVNKRNGQVHLNIGSSSDTDVYLDGTSAGSTSTSLSGTITNLYAMSCNGQVQVSADVGTVYMIPRSRSRADVQLTSASDDADVLAKGRSNLLAQGELDTTHTWGGATITINDSSSNQTGAVKLRDGGVVKYLGNDASATLGFGSTVTLYGGELDVSKSQAPSLTFSGQVTTYADSILNVANGVDAAAFASSIKYYGGTLKIDPGRKATPT